MKNELTIELIDEASKNIKGVAKNIPLQYSKRLSQTFGAKVYLKREDLQEVRSYKIRGAYNLMCSLTKDQRKDGVVCASAGNHAQGVAFSAKLLKTKATIFMPTITPLQKINKVKNFGGLYVNIKLVGNTFDECSLEAISFAKKHNLVFVHPFDDYRVIAGQGTIGKEIFDALGNLDYIFCPVGGGGLVSGAGTYLKNKLPQVKIIGVEPKGAASMNAALIAKRVTTLNTIDTFVDGAAVKTVGLKTFKLASKLIDKMVLVDEGKVCSTMIELYQNEGIVTEPAGALSISSLDEFAKDIKGKVVVCILSGGNNDILRYPEIMEKSLIYQGLKHYFLINFAQKPGQLKQFVDEVLGPTDDIARFEYIKKTTKERGPALIGVELAKKEDFEPLIKRMKTAGIIYTLIDSTDPLYSYLI